MSTSQPDTSQSTAAPPVLSAVGVSKAFGSNQALDDVSFELERGTIHALLGGNGSGKSTLIKILAGVESADIGRIELDGEGLDLSQMTPAVARAAGLHFVHQQQSTFPELSVAENLAIGHGFETSGPGRISWRKARRRGADVLARFEIEATPDQDLGELSPARRTMVAIARALQDQEDSSDGVLLLDEPTASLPTAEVKILLDSLLRYADAGQAIVYVTHRLEEVFAIAGSATLLRDGKVVETVKPKDLTHDMLVQLMLGRTVEKIKRVESQGAGNVVLEARNVTAGPVRSVDLDLSQGEIVGVAGLIGSGRSTLLKALFGLVPLEDGDVVIEGESCRFRQPSDAMRKGCAYVPEDRHSDAAFPGLSVNENLTLTVVPDYWRHGVLHQRRERADSRKLFDQFLIRAQSEEDTLDSLSGGNQQKVVLARWLRRQPKVLLLDEPTQGVDVGARAEIYELISKAVASGATALVASSDFEELTAVCHRVIVLRRGRVAGVLKGEQLDPDGLATLANAEVTL